MRQKSRLFMGVVALALAATTLAPSIAGARLRFWQFTATQAFVTGRYQYTACMPGPLISPARQPSPGRSRSRSTDTRST